MGSESDQTIVLCSVLHCNVVDTQHTPPKPQQMPAHRWAEGAVVYQACIRSVQDSNGDGNGDLAGFMQRLGYLRELGVNAIWLSPVYVSPMVDFGYDISDYYAIDPSLGTIDDFRQLLAQAHGLGLKVIMDLVPNHTSNTHIWFQQSRASKDNPYADWYIWKDAHPDFSPDAPQPPNNWIDEFTGNSAWQWDEHRRQFYLHSFDVSQPDLNWTNSEVREAIKAVMRHWLDMGVDGFRIDAVDWLAKDPQFGNEALNPKYVEGVDTRDKALIHNKSRGWPNVYAYVAEMAQVLKEEAYRSSARFMVTEAYPDSHNPVAAYMAFYEGVDPLVAAPFNFEGLLRPWRSSYWCRFVDEFHHALHEHSSLCVASYAFGNHDKPRLVTRLGEPAARSVAVMSLTLPGMIFVYNGDEIGMHDVDIPLAEVLDPAALGDATRQGRDRQRTPMQWSTDKNAGFSTADKTWLPVSADYAGTNVAVQQNDPHSSLSLYRKLIGLRNHSDALRYGDITVVNCGNPDVLSYIRTKGQERYLTLINFSDQSVTCHPGFALHKFVVSSDPQTKLAQLAEALGSNKVEIELLPHEGVLFEV